MLWSNERKTKSKNGAFYSNLFIRLMQTQIHGQSMVYFVVYKSRKTWAKKNLDGIFIIEYPHYIKRNDEF